MSGRQAGAGALFAATLVASFAAGCGPLVPTETYETPLLSFEARLTDPAEGAQISRPKVGIVWVDPLALGDDLPQAPSGIRVTALPDEDDTYRVDLFAPPPEAAIRRLPDPDTQELAVSFAFGEIVLYDDGDGDGTFAITSRQHGSLMFPPDAYRGSTESRAVIYVEKPARPAALTGNVWLTLTEGPGYRLVSIDCHNGGPPTVNTLSATDRTASIRIERDSSAELIVSRSCLSPTRPAIDAKP